MSATSSSTVISVSSEFESSSSYLKRVNASGQSLYDHLVQLVLKLQTDTNSADLLTQIEQLSVQIKQSSIVSDVKKEVPTATKLSEAQQQLTKFVNLQDNLLKKTQNYFVAKTE